MSLRIPLHRLVSLLVLCSSAFAGTRYVDASRTTGSNDGSSWANAFQGPLGLQAALTAATAGDQIWVARGSYFAAPPGTNWVSFTLKNGVELYGGFAGNETLLEQRDHVANPSILDGDLGGNDANGVYQDNTQRIVTALGVDSTALLDGFTVQNGFMMGSYFGTNNGAGIELVSSSVRVVHCTLYNNTAEHGGGVYIYGGHPLLRETTVVFNYALVQGGGVFVKSTDTSQSVLFDRCRFLTNDSDEGGGVFVDQGGSARFVNCVLWNNYSRLRGGALSAHAAATLDQCIVAGNISDWFQPGGIYGAGFSVPVHNSIVYFNAGPGGSMGPADNVLGGVSPSWSCVQGGLTGPGMIATDPQFLSWSTGDLRLASTSPCCDAGSNALVPAEALTDLVGAPRRADDPLVADTGAGSAPIVDMGAYELPNALYSTFCLGDGTQSTPCPCGNSGAPGRGCAASDPFSIGARLVATGTATPDTVVLSASDLLASVTCVFLQGDQQNANGVVFGDGVRCVAGSLKRLFIKSASGGAASAPGVGDPSISARSAALGDTIAPGSLRYYQVYYRDPDLTFCPAPQGNSWNVSSGVILQW